MTTRRTIRIEVTDQSDELEDQAVLVREFVLNSSFVEKKPTELVGALAAWLDLRDLGGTAS